MKTNSLRLLALAAVFCWQGLPTGNAQHVPLPAVNPGQAASGLEYFDTGKAPTEAKSVSYQHGYESGPVYEGGDYQGTPGLQPYGHQTPPGSYINQVDDSSYYDPYQPDEHGIAPGGPLGGEVFDPIYPAGHCYGYTRGEVFVLTRDLKATQAFASRGQGGPIVLSLADLDLEFEAGIRGVAGVPLSNCLTLEVSYFGLQEWSESAAATDANGNLFSIYSNFGANGGFDVNGQPVLSFIDQSSFQSISYETELHNAEANLMYRIPTRCWKQEAWLVAGTRFVKVEENLQYFTQTPAVLRSFTNVHTDNDMVGVQLGGILHHHVTRKFRVSLDAKAAMMVNFVEQESIVLTNQFLLGERDRDDTLALVTDAGAGMAFDVTCWFSITGGYRFMFVDGAALAGRNFNPVLPGSGLRQPNLDDNGDIIYHGAHLGAELRW